MAACPVPCPVGGPAQAVSALLLYVHPYLCPQIHDKDSAKAARMLNMTYEDYLPRDLHKLYAKQQPDQDWYK